MEDFIKKEDAMKKILCFFIILTHLSIIVGYAQQGTIKTNIEPQQGQLAQEQSGQSEVEVGRTESRTAVAEPVAGTKKDSNIQKTIKTTEEKQPTEAKGEVVLREKVSDQNPLRKVARGAVNVTLGWAEIPRQVIKVNKENGDIAGVFWGPLKGFAFFIGRTAIGVYEVTTFLLPPYKPVVKPEFIFSEEEEN